MLYLRIVGNCYFLGDPDGDDILEESKNRQSSELYKVRIYFFMRYILIVMSMSCHFNGLFLSSNSQVYEYSCLWIVMSINSDVYEYSCLWIVMSINSDVYE